MKKITIEIDEDLYKVLGMLWGYESVEEIDKDSIQWDITEYLIQHLDELREVGELDEATEKAYDQYVRKYVATLREENRTEDSEEPEQEE